MFVFQNLVSHDALKFQLKFRKMSWLQSGTHLAVWWSYATEEMYLVDTHQLKEFVLLNSVMLKIKRNHWLSWLRSGNKPQNLLASRGKQKIQLELIFRSEKDQQTNELPQGTQWNEISARNYNKYGRATPSTNDENDSHIYYSIKIF